MKAKLWMSIAAAAVLCPVALAAAHIVGNEHDNVLNGTSGGDTIEGKGGNDNLSGLAGNDALFGGPGADKEWGGAGNDEVTGGDGSDAIWGGCNGSCAAGSNDLFGGAGNDLLGADNGVGKETVNGMGGYDTCYVDISDDWSSCEKLIIDGASP